MRRWLIFVGGLFLVAPVAAAEIGWTPDIPGALAASGSSGKPILVDVWANWCVPCKQMDDTTYRDPAVVAAAAAFVPLKVDWDLQEIFTGRYHVESLPTVLILDGEGRLIARREGLIGTPGLLEFMETIRRGYGTYLEQMPRAKADPAAAESAAGYLLEAGNPTEAARLLKGALKSLKDAGPERREPLELQLAEAELAGAELKAAAGSFEKLSAGAVDPQIRGQALEGLVRSQRARGKAAEADAALARLEREFPDRAARARAEPAAD